MSKALSRSLLSRLTMRAFLDQFAVPYFRFTYETFSSRRLALLRREIYHGEDISCEGGRLVLFGSEVAKLSFIEGIQGKMRDDECWWCPDKASTMIKCLAGKSLVSEASRLRSIA